MWIDGNEWLVYLGLVGKLFEMMMMKVFDVEGNEFLFGEVGEIFMMFEMGLGLIYYYFGVQVKECDGWELFGDMGWMDEDGYFYLSD